MFNQFNISGINTNDCPCRFCTSETGRCSGCHSTCEDRYIPWKQKHEQKLNDKNKDSDSRSLYYEGARRRNKSLSTSSINFGRAKK